MMKKANYSYSVEDVFVCIEDLKNGSSVTNGIEAVLEQITREVGRLSNRFVIYKDSFGTWDQVVIDPFGLFVRFDLLGTDSKEVAKLLVSTAHQEGRPRPWSTQSIMEPK